MDLAAAREAQLSGDPWTAIEILESLIAARPADVEARYWLASAKLTAREPDAGQAMEDARILHALPLVAAMGGDPGRCRSDPAYANAVADRLYADNLVAMSGVVRTLAISAGGANVQGLLGFGLSLQHQGRLEEACEVFRMADESFPSPQVHQFVLFPLLFCDDGEARHAQESREWARRHVSVAQLPPPPNAPRTGRRLRIGYLAPRFAGSQLRQFIAPLLDNHDPEAVEVTLYPASAETETGWPDWIKVRPIGHLDDAAAAAQIRGDGIDVLADCWGHTAGSKLPVFARRPAPVQMAWINFAQTTGLSQIDYIPHATTDRPPATEGLFTEEIWPIGPTFTAFRASSGRLDPTDTPALRTGQVTFGSFNHPAKLSDWALDAWAGILRGAPNSRLLLKYGYFRDQVLQRVTQARFAARGVEPERIVFADRSEGEAYFAAFRTVDLMLDAWPAPGSTTTLDALSNGVPVLTMVEPVPSVGGAYARSILLACGLPELVADGPEAFVERGLELAADLQALNALRSRTRAGFDTGPYGDEAGFTRRLEQAFGEMFDRWRAGADQEAAAL